jgi:hypothetical protein
MARTQRDSAMLASESALPPDGHCSVKGGCRVAGLDLNPLSRHWATNPDTRRQVFSGHQSDTKTPEAGWASGVRLKSVF